MITLSLKPPAKGPTTRRTGELVRVGVRAARKIRLSPGFTRVKNLDNDKVGTLQDILSEMVTVYYDDDSMDFFFKKYHGLSWREL